MDGLYDGRREVKTKKWSLYRLDVQNAFLHGENNKEVGLSNFPLQPSIESWRGIPSSWLSVFDLSAFMCGSRLSQSIWQTSSFWAKNSKIDTAKIIFRSRKWPNQFDEHHFSESKIAEWLQRTIFWAENYCVKLDTAWWLYSRDFPHVVVSFWFCCAQSEKAFH